MVQLIVAFRNFANVTKKEKTILTKCSPDHRSEATVDAVRQVTVSNALAHLNCALRVKTAQQAP
jgi:hypothetical protein